jgi:ParB family transcriptional regulator, chromosome partitioning protein
VAVAEAIEKAGGCVVGSYKDPLGGHPLLLSVLPIGAIEPTPFQRDLSDTHHKRLADVINKTGRFLDPIIAVTAPNHGFWTPNGRQRLEAMRRLGAKSITALVVADREVAWQILALNTEKAHNLKERALEVIRIYRGLVEEDASRPESQFAFYLDEPRFGHARYLLRESAAFWRWRIPSNSAKT